MSHQQTVTYWAISILNSKTFWVAVITSLVGLAAEPEIVALIPLSYLPRVLIAVGLANMVLRKLTKRPVVLLAAPFATVPVEVKRIGPPTPAVLED